MVSRPWVQPPRGAFGVWTRGGFQVAFAFPAVVTAAVAAGPHPWDPETLPKPASCRPLGGRGSFI